MCICNCFSIYMEICIYVCSVSVLPLSCIAVSWAKKKKKTQMNNETLQKKKYINWNKVLDIK